MTLHPAPRRIDLAGTGGSTGEIGVATDRSLPEQGYRLTVSVDGTTIDHADELGLRYARDTLGQLEASGTVGTGVIEDWPDFVNRGFMLDVSRDRVPTMERLRWLVDILGRLRFTELQLYTEHTFAWPDHEVVWRDASPMTPDELEVLDGWCADAGMTLVPCLNGFGHMERFLRHDAYRKRAECPDGAPALFGPDRTPPTTLAPTPDNAEFAVDLFRQYLAAVPARRLHIGGDEPFELGLCRSADRVSGEGRAAVYTEHLRRLIEPFTSDGLEVLFWGDVLSRAPEHATQLPTGATAVAWWYAPPQADPPPISALFGAEVAERMGFPEDALRGFAAHTRPYAEVDVPFWVAPGTSTWNSLVGRWPDARENIVDAVTVGAERGARGVLLADWGDGGHHQPLPISLPPLVHAAEAAWCQDRHDASGVPSVVDRLVGAQGFGDALVAIGGIDRRLGVRQFNASAVNNALFGTFLPPGRRREDRDAFHAAEELLAGGAGIGEIEGLDPALTIEVQAACRLARNGLWRLARALGLPAPAEQDIAHDLAAAIEQQRDAWLRSSRPGGLADSLARLEAQLPA